MRDLSLAGIFAAAVVNELVDDATSSVSPGDGAWSGIGADIDDDRRAVADDNGLGRRSRTGTPPQPPQPPPPPMRS